MYQPPQRRDDPRYVGLTGFQLNTLSLLLLAGVIGGASAWLFALGGIASVNDTVSRLRHEFTLLVSGKDVPSAAVDVPETWFKVEPDGSTEKALVDEIRVTNPDLARTIERELSYFGGLEILFLAFDPQAPEGSLTTANIIGQRYSSSTTLQEEIASIEEQLASQGGTVSITSDISIGGFPAALVNMRYPAAAGEVAAMQYVVLAEPDLVFAITFITTPDRVDGLAPLFQQIAGTFRLTDE